MVGNGQVFISHTPEDDALCAPLLEALRAWGVDFWYEAGGNGAEDEVPERQQRAITTRDTFIRVCSAHTMQSFEMTREFALFKRSIQETPRPELLVIFFIVSDGFVLDTVDNMSVAIDSVNSMPVVWQSALYHALGLSPQGQEGADVIVPALPAVQEQPAPEHLVEGDAWEPFHETATQPAPPFIVPEMPTTTHHPRQEVTSQSTPPPPQQRHPQRVLVLLALLVLISCGSIGVVWHAHTTSAASGNGTQGGGVGNAATAAIPTEQATSTPDIQVATTTPGPDQPLPTVIPNTPLPPGAPPVSYADSATVTLTRATQSAQLPPATVTISNAAGDVRLRPTQVNDSATGTANPDAPHQDATFITALLTITNNSSIGLTSPAGTTIVSTNGVSCTQQVTVTVPAKTSLSQQPCAEPAQYEPATTYYATLPNGLLYTGSAPAGGSVAGYRVPAGCGDINNVLPTAVHNLLQVFDTALQGAIRYTQQISNFPMTCIPDAGTTHPQPFGYQQSLTVTGTAVGYRPNDIQSYQHSHVSADAGTTLIAIADCTPTVSSVDQAALSAVITCPATGTEAAQLNLAALANLIVGKDPTTATSILNGITGIVSGSVHITLSNHAVLPQNTTKIIFIITP